MNRVNFYCPIGFEKWDHRNYTERGIGGSETCVCEMSWRLAQRGFEVTVYGHLDVDCPTPWRGVHWQELEEANPSEEALWILCRCPREAQ